MINKTKKGILYSIFVIALVVPMLSALIPIDNANLNITSQDSLKTRTNSAPYWFLGDLISESLACNQWYSYSGVNDEGWETTTDELIKHYAYSANVFQDYIEVVSTLTYQIDIDLEKIGENFEIRVYSNVYIQMNPNLGESQARIYNYNTNKYEVKQTIPSSSNNKWVLIDFDVDSLDYISDAGHVKIDLRSMNYKYTPIIGWFWGIAGWTWVWPGFWIPIMAQYPIFGATTWPQIAVTLDFSEVSVICDYNYFG